jgi:hypothetical protein
VIGTALAVTTAIYLMLAVTTIAVLGREAATDVPLAALLARAAGGDGTVIAAAVAVVLTLGTTNAYLTGAVTMARDLARSPARGRSGRPFLAIIAVAGAALLGLYGAGLVTTAQIVTLPTTLFLIAYLGCTHPAHHAVPHRVPRLHPVRHPHAARGRPRLRGGGARGRDRAAGVLRLGARARRGNRRRGPAHRGLAALT